MWRKSRKGSSCEVGSPAAAVPFFRYGVTNRPSSASMIGSRPMFLPEVIDRLAHGTKVVVGPPEPPRRPSAGDCGGGEARSCAGRVSVLSRPPMPHPLQGTVHHFRSMSRKVNYNFLTLATNPGCADRVKNRMLGGGFRLESAVSSHTHDLRPPYQLSPARRCPAFSASASLAIVMRFFSAIAAAPRHFGMR